MRRTAPHLIKVAFLALLGVGAACSSVEVTGPEVVFQVIEETTFDPSLEIDLTQMTKLSSGVYTQDLVLGEGAELVTGDIAEVSYQGWLSNGLLFDQGDFSFLTGNQEVIPGFELGVLGMKVGGTRRLLVPPELGYGSSYVGAIPPGSILVFEVDLVGTQ